MIHDRIPPHSLEAEMALLGALMIQREFVAIVMAHVAADDFYAPQHAAVFAVIAALYDRNQPTDKIAVATELRTRGALEKCGGVSYLSSLYDSVQSASSVEYYAKIIAEKAVLRRMIAAAAQITSLAFNGEEDPAEAVSLAESALRSATSKTAHTDAGSSAEDAFSRVYRSVVEASESKTPPGISSPWPGLDQRVGRTFGGEMVVWAAAPMVGKSIAMAQLALHVAMYHGQVAFFALEMGEAGTTRRMLAKAAGVSGRRLRLGELRGSEWDNLGSGLDALMRLPLRFFDRMPKRSVADVRRCLRRMSLDGPVKAVVVDHANFLADAIQSGRMSKHERLDAVYQELLQIAGEFDCVMHVVQHFNRAGMDEPSLSSLRDGGNLEGHANIVIFPVRKDIAQNPESGEFIVAKNRESDLCRIPMRFDGMRQEWSEMTEFEVAS